MSPHTSTMNPDSPVLFFWRFTHGCIVLLCIFLCRCAYDWRL